jgi:hypothetical protein
LLKIYGVILTNSFANTTFLLFEVKAAFINICDKGNCLRVVYMDGLILRYFLIKWIGVFDRAVFYAGSTTRAFPSSILAFGQAYLEVSYLPIYTVHFSIGETSIFGCRPTSTSLGERIHMEQSLVGKVLSSWAIWPPMLGAFSTR